MRRVGFPPVPHGGGVPVHSGVCSAAASVTSAALTVVLGLQQPDMSVIVDEDLMVGLTTPRVRICILVVGVGRSKLMSNAWM